MKVNDYKKTISVINKGLNFIIDNLSNKIFDDYGNISKTDYLTVAKKAKKIINEINSHNPIAYPNDYSFIETERFERNITRLAETTELIKNEVSTDNELESLSIILNRLIPIYRVAKSFNLETNIDEKTQLLSNEIDDNLKTIKELISKSENSVSEAMHLVKKTQETYIETKELTQYIKDEFILGNEKTNKINSLLIKSETAYANIDTIKNTLDTASTSLKYLQDKSELMVSNFDAHISSSLKKVDSLLDKEERISTIEDSLNTHIKQSGELIDSAKEAMTLAGTFRLSRSFKSAYLISKKTRDRWAIASVVSAIVSLTFVIVMLYEMYVFDYSIFLKSTTPAIMMFIARFSMLPVVIGFFAFCAMQYIKQNNICEDYAHKKLLSETLISFKDELTNAENDKTANFLSEILKVVLRSPINFVDKKTHQSEITHINSMLSQTNEIGKSLLDKLTTKNP
ncbi:hypothetical protein AAY84_19395 [Serratia marcescens]|uniref:hypothetical protein n=1 Tax=Serratia marcescens TaxID=615 RepID=UPI00062C6CD6|nr:hypothetical protein [Serratia marcescens]KKZ17242.1 hypothetical protein AAY84_19395 [Serratia marcescens]